MLEDTADRKNKLCELCKADLKRLKRGQTHAFIMFGASSDVEEGSFVRFTSPLSAGTTVSESSILLQ